MNTQKTAAETEEENEDILDLIGWAITNAPDLYNAVRFLHVDNFAAALRAAHKIAGSPQLN